MLTHELNNYTMSEAMKFYPQLKAAFTGGLVPIAVALNETQPYMENNISFPSYSQYLQGQITPSSNPSAAASASATASAKGGSSAGGAIGMPSASSGLVGAIVVTLAFLGGVARVAA